jgi:hypothetical protein
MGNVIQIIVVAPKIDVGLPQDVEPSSLTSFFIPSIQGDQMGQFFAIGLLWEDHYAFLKR